MSPSKLVSRTLAIAFFAALEVPTRAVLGPTLWLSKRVPLVGRAVERFGRLCSDEAIESVFDRWFSKARLPILRGDLEVVAARRWPRETFPYLWHTDIPSDLRRDLVIDGRLPDGSLLASVLAPTFVDRALVGSACRRAVLAGLFWGSVCCVLWSPQVSIGHRPVSFDAITLPAANPALAAVDTGPDVWTEADRAAAVAAATAQATATRDVLAARVEAAYDLAPNGLLTSIFFGLLCWFGAWRWMIRDAANAKTLPLARETKESTVRFKWRLEQRSLAERAYVSQLETAEWDRTPLIEIGRATGTFGYRGMLGAPGRGQPVCASVQDMAAHCLVLGGTGSGKTRNVLLPIVRQFLALRRSDRGGISVYATDGKAVLWADIVQAAEEAGQRDDVRIIGIGEEEWGVDLLDGIEPQLVADVIKSVAIQAKGGGGSGDDFWPSMAAEFIRNCAVIARAAEVTPWGLARIKSTGERLYSLVWIYQLALDPDLQSEAINAVVDATQNPSLRSVLLPMVTPELTYAVRYLSTTWQEMASDTRTGVIANITALMSPFATNVALRKAFASGSGERLMSIAECWGRITLTRISELEQGLAGRVINVFLKTLLYAHARRRELADSQIGFREKMLFVADEFQSIVTSDVAGPSDSTFWNVARSAGVIGVLATQSLSAIEQAIGRIATDNLAQQMRTKLVLSLEDAGTIDYCKKLAGKSLRSYTFDNARFESFESMQRETLWDPLSGSPARLRPDDSAICRDVARAALGLFGVFAPIRFTEWLAAVEVDQRFDDDDDGGKSAAWRAEDKRDALMQSGNVEEDILRSEDLVLMGRAHAFALVNRAGVARLDIIEL